MFSYIYADGRGNINYAIGSKTKQGIESLALENINNMIRGEVGYNSSIAPPLNKEQQDVIEACEKKDAYRAIEAWNKYATMVLKHTISCHKIEPFSIVE